MSAKVLFNTCRRLDHCPHRWPIIVFYKLRMLLVQFFFDMPIFPMYPKLVTIEKKIIQRIAISGVETHDLAIVLPMKSMTVENSNPKSYEKPLALVVHVYTSRLLYPRRFRTTI